MKKNLFLVLIILLFSSKSYSQFNLISENSNTSSSNESVRRFSNFSEYSTLKFDSDSLNSRNYFLQKRTKLNRAGWSLLTLGLATSVINQLFIPTKSISQGGGFSTEKSIVTILSIGSIVASIPCFIGAHKNKVKALNFSLKNEQVNLPSRTNVAVSTSYVAFAVKIKI